MTSVEKLGLKEKSKWLAENYELLDKETVEQYVNTLIDTAETCGQHDQEFKQLEKIQ